MKSEKIYLDITGLKSAIFGMNIALSRLQKELAVLTKESGSEDKILIVRNIVPDAEFIEMLKKCVELSKTFSQKCSIL